MDLRRSNTNRDEDGTYDTWFGGFPEYLTIGIVSRAREVFRR